MKLEDIFELWNEDSQIDSQNLGDEALKIASLHHKYYQILIHERMALRQREADLKVLRLEKYEFYTQGPTKETQEKGWKLPPIGRVLKADAMNYVDTDADVVKATLRVGTAGDKVDLLESIMKSLQTRGYQIKSAIEWAKFTSGG